MFKVMSGSAPPYLSF